MNLLFFLDKLNKIFLYLAIFLIPLFFLPFTLDVLGHSKQILLLCLIFLSGVCWLVKQQIQGKIIIRENKLLYLALFFIFVFFSLSTIFSLWPEASFWGWPLSPVNNLLAFSSFLLLALLFVNTFQDEKEVFFALLLLLISGVMAGVFVLLQLYGIFILPFDFAKISSFNTLGNVSQAAIFLALLLPLSLVLAFRIRKPIFWIIFLILTGLVILIDFSGAWIVLLLGILFLAIFGFAGSKEKISALRIGILMGILVLAIFFLFFPLRLPGFPVLPLQVSPGIVSGLEILSGVYDDGIQNILLGTGPGTFVFNYSKYRSPLLNLTIFWGTRFSSGNSEFLDWFITKGVLVGMSLFFFLGLIIYFGIKGLIKAGSIFGIRLGFLASAIAMIGAGFLSPFNFSLWFIFWIIIGGLLFYNSKKREIVLGSQFRRVVFSAIILVVIIFGMVLLLSQSQKYLAEINYAKGTVFAQEDNVDQAISFIQRATLLNPSNDVYWRDLAQLYLVRANLIVQDQELAPEQRRQLVEENIASGIESLNQAISLAPFNVTNWNVRGFFYRSLIGIPGSGEIALESYRKAAELEPASPFPHGEIGRVYILMAQNFREREMPDDEKTALYSAIKSLERSIELKLDYAPAHYLLAVAYDQLGREGEAIARLEKIRRIAPHDIGVSFQLGMLFWRKEELDQAQRKFEKIIRLNPYYSNARYMLGLVYDKKGEKEKARAEFEKVAQLNPENQEVAKILKNLNKGFPALEGIILLQPPIREIPPEIQM